MVWGGGCCPRERDLREIYIENTVLSFVSVLCCFCLHITEYEQIRGGGGAKFSWTQGRKIPKYGPGDNTKWKSILGNNLTNHSTARNFLPTDTVTVDTKSV
jgi:hypothetical protein